ncbi:MOSC domain-containing protein [Cytobacillus purgationiresistens]|uniref:Uncharacterized protein YcbX n=1 Tax=Cytobacillus purgationiresistens TaxID=863449 RepID=A0ABU0ANN4_9BACI|nr:MOSC domain-containing protein [Cytobacillus purgationiresistens]MDQ0272911.1 uncharacterized protein YcbX [Cytobacillus purgationiresistens]
MQLIGHVGKILRYPVKSLGGESVSSARVMYYGMYGDRSHTILDESRQGKYLTITQFQEMVKYKARFIGEESADRYPAVEIITPDGKVFVWEDEEWRKELESKSKRRLSYKQYSPAHVPIGAIEEEPLLVVSDASLKSLSEMTGKQLIDEQRFRPNILLDLIDKTPFLEEEWVTKHLTIGEVEIQVDRFCERCMIITVDPQTGERDANVHKQVIRHRKNNFGVYASVIKTGSIHIGDEVWIKEKV